MSSLASEGRGFVGAAPAGTIGATHTRYTRVAMWLHWLIAAFILFNLTLGWFMEGFPPAVKGIVMPLHISCGITVLALTALRVLWRLTHAPPPLDDLKPAERNSAHFVHFLLYAGMVLMPLTGWSILSAHPAPGSPGAAIEAASRPAPPPSMKAPLPGGGGIKIWYVLPLPSITALQEVGNTPGGVAPQKQLHDRFVGWHALGGYMMIALLLLHVGGALKHQWIDRQDELGRIGLRVRRQYRGVRV